jgi:octopine/nopaline transport system substrate-binding protein
MAKKTHFWLLLCFALATASQVLPTVAAEPIKIVVEGTYPPWNTQTNDGKLTGFDVELAQEVCKRAELQCEISAQVWDSQIPSLLEGKFDAMMTVGPTPKRLKVMIFSTPYAATPLTFAVMKSGTIKELPHAGEKINADDTSAAQAMDDIKAALKGKKVGVMGSTSLQEFLETNFKDGVDIRPYKSEPDQILDLKADRIDIVFDSSAFLRGAVTKSGNEDVAVTGPLFSAKTLATTVCFGLRPDQTALKAKFDAAITAAAADGTIKTISQKWFGFDISP